MELSPLAQAELRALVNRHDVSARIATRARIVLWAAEGRIKKDIAMLAGVSRPTVDFWIDRYGFGGVAALARSAWRGSTGTDPANGSRTDLGIDP